MKVAFFAEIVRGEISPVAYELLTRTLGLAPPSEITALVVSPPLADSELANLSRGGAGRIVAYESDRFARFDTESFSRVFQAFCDEVQPDVLLGGATTVGRTLFPYAAMKLRTGLTADCTQLAIEPETGLLLQTRPAIGGNIMATIKTPRHKPQMATVRPHSTPKAVIQPDAAVGRIIRRAVPDEWFSSNGPELLSTVETDKSEELADARRVVVVGRGIKRGENLHLAKKLATLLDASLGATREAVDRGWLPFQYQIGLSGRTITPELYVGLGVSGAVQHLAGMRTAERIVAVNSDPEAQIFRVADLGIVGDLFEVLPNWIAELEKGGDR